jgi:hypothetical protein
MTAGAVSLDSIYLSAAFDPSWPFACGYNFACGYKVIAFKEFLDFASTSIRGIPPRRHAFGRAPFERAIRTVVGLLENSPHRLVTGRS